MPIIESKGAGSAQGFGEFAQQTAANYIENVFSTYLYTGTGSAQTITNNIDLSTKGGMVWVKGRSSAQNNLIGDTVQGVGKTLIPNSTLETLSNAQYWPAWYSNGFGIGTDGTWNTNTYTYASWTFRKQPKFFDIVTYTGNSNSSTMLSHSLGSVPGCIIVKCTNTTSNWFTWHIASGITSSVTGFQLNDYTGPQVTGYNASSDFTSTQFKPSAILDSASNAANVSGNTYVAYFFASNAGGFGLTGTDNVITCGTYTGNGSTTGPTITLGYEPQWLMIKRNGNTNWTIIDSMRGFINSTSATPSDPYLEANTTRAETTWGADYGQNAAIPLATGFQLVTSDGSLNLNNTAFYYIAIRRGPMAVPTVGTSVFSPNISSGSVGTVITTNFPVDMQINSVRDITFDKTVVDRLRGVVTTPTDTLATRLRTNLTNAEGDNFYSRGWNNTGFQMPTTIADASDIFWNFGRAPSFFDVVCYTGTATAGTTKNHNLGVVPEMMIIKKRSSPTAWAVYHSALGATSYVNLNTTSAVATSSGYWNDTAPTSSVFTLGTDNDVDASGDPYVAYLFATCAGVSKVGSYTGTGTLTTINCGFTGGARFVLIKKTSASSNWFVWDTARGMVSGTDNMIPWNTTTAQANADSVYTIATGFQLLASPSADVNTSGASYIFLAIS